MTARREPELLGQTVVVIGGSLGIGLETARKARAEGASVIITARNPERLAAAGRELGAETAAFETLPIGRVIGPEDIATLAIHLMSNTALTGATFDIDGGQQLT